ncbi:MAG: hypothetical protein K6E29_09435 [Cyanobacteria bacterium RUI128]|nr:hypothetical protein [Cyanobacteria bacterium RUI128]
MTGSPTINLPGNINLSGGEVQNAKLQSLTSKSNATEADYWYDSVNHIPKYHNGTDECEFGRIYTGGTGITVSNGNAISVDDYDKLLKNITNATNSISVGDNSATQSYSVNIGYGSTAENGCVAIGNNAKSYSNGVSIGNGADPHGSYCIAVGCNAKTDVGLSYTYQIGSGTNNSEKTLAIGFGKDANNQALEYTLLDGTTGLIPDARLSSNIARSANIPTTVAELIDSSNYATKTYVSDAIALAQAGALLYQTTWTATNQTDYSSITLPVKKGYMYPVSGSATIGGVEWNSGDYLVINKDIASSGSITSSDVDKIDNTEASDILRLNATQTLTNKTIDADDNTITDLTTSNLKSGVLQTTLRGVASASDSALASEKAIAKAIKDFITGITSSDVITALGYTPAKKISVTNSALTSSNGVVTWSMTNPFNSEDVGVDIYEVDTSSNKKIYPAIEVTSSTITVTLLSSSNKSAGDLKAVITG